MLTVFCIPISNWVTKIRKKFNNPAVPFKFLFFFIFLKGKTIQSEKNLLNSFVYFEQEKKRFHIFSFLLPTLSQMHVSTKVSFSTLYIFPFRQTKNIVKVCVKYTWNVRFMLGYLLISSLYVLYTFFFIQIFVFVYSTTDWSNWPEPVRHNEPENKSNNFCHFKSFLTLQHFMWESKSSFLFFVHPWKKKLIFISFIQ